MSELVFQLTQFNFQGIEPLVEFVEREDSLLIGIQKALSLVVQNGVTLLPAGAFLLRGRRVGDEGLPGIVNALGIVEELGQSLPDQGFDGICVQDTGVLGDASRPVLATEAALVEGTLALSATVEQASTGVADQQTPEQVGTMTVALSVVSVHL